MRKALMLGTVLAALVGLVPLAAFAQSDEGDGRSYARLSFVKGDVSVDRGADLGTETAEVNLPVAAGDKLVTSDGQAEIQFGRSNFLRLGVSSEAEFASLPGRSGDPVKLHIRAGQAYIRVTTLDAEKGIEVHTPDASFYILEEGLYRFDISEGGATEILVHEGSAEAAGEEGSVVVRSHERIVAANGAFRSDPETFRAAMDGFDRWNGTRDELIDRRSGTSYLPAAISEYENELEDNGRWVNEASYGYVWVPYVHDVEWRPYMYGRWVWYPIIGWTWVSSEPWGWATYHYGRWHWRFGLGWYWIPTTHWGPAWVHWYHGRDHYGWCPLSYYNRPGVILNGRYHDRWYGNDYPWNSRALTVVRRDRLQSPAISRHALRSSELGALGRISLRSEQPNVRPSVARTSLASPALKPVSAAGSRATLAERGALSKGTLRSPASGNVSGITSKSRTWTSTGRSGSAGNLSGSISGAVSRARTYPSRSGGSVSSGAMRSPVVERPSGLKAGRSSVGTVSGTVKSSPGGVTKTYPSTIRSRTSNTSSLKSSGVREYAPASTVKSSGYRTTSSNIYRSTRSYSRTNDARVYSAPRSATRSYSYSAPARSYSAPSYSGRSYSSGSVSRSSGPSSRSSVSRSTSSPRSSRSSSSSRTSSSSKASSSPGRSGSIRKK